MIAVCGQCGKDFEARRVTAKFCSAACRVANHRGAVVEVAEPVAVQTQESALVRCAKLAGAREVEVAPEARLRPPTHFVHNVEKGPCERCLAAGVNPY